MTADAKSLATMRGFHKQTCHREDAISGTAANILSSVQRSSVWADRASVRLSHHLSLRGPAHLDSLQTVTAQMNVYLRRGSAMAILTASSKSMASI